MLVCISATANWKLFDHQPPLPFSQLFLERRMKEYAQENVLQYLRIMHTSPCYMNIYTSIYISLYLQASIRVCMHVTIHACMHVYMCMLRTSHAHAYMHIHLLYPDTIIPSGRITGCWKDGPKDTCWSPAGSSTGWLKSRPKETSWSPSGSRIG